MKLDGIKLLEHIKEKRKELKSYGEIDMSSSLYSLQKLIESGQFTLIEDNETK